MEKSVKLQILLVGLFLSGFAFADAALKFDEPLLTPAKAYQATLQYMKNERPDIEIDKYDIGSLTFDYKSRKWGAIFQCKGDELPPGCHFSVNFTDEKSPSFRVWGGA